MSTKEKLILHVKHIYGLRLSQKDLAAKIKSVEALIEFSQAKGDISHADKQEILALLHSPQKENDSTVVKQLTVPAKHKIFHIKTLAIIAMVLGAIVAGGIIYNNSTHKQVQLVNASDIKKDGRILRFQGKLLDSSGLPLNHKVDVKFRLYPQKNQGNPLYTGSCLGENGIVPDMAGNFKVSIGADCAMNKIPDALFSKSEAVYLGIQVENNQELSPRYPIANVQYSTNTDKVKGLTLGTSESTIPYIDEEGHLIIGAVSPVLKSTEGEFSIEGQTVSIKTNEDNGSSISLVPAVDSAVIIPQGKVGIGTTEPQYKLDIIGDLGISQDVMLTGKNTNFYQNQGGSIRIYTAKDVDDLTSPALFLGSENKIGLATNTLVDAISAGGSISPVENGKFNLGSATNKWRTIYTNELITADQGIAAFWQRKGSILSPAKPGDDFVLGSTTEQNSVVKLGGKPNTPSWITSGLLGLGTSTPHHLFTAMGKQNNLTTASITNLSEFDTSGTNGLRINLGTPVTGQQSKFVDFYAGATSETTGKNVGSIRLQNGGVVYETKGADFAEYIDTNTPARAGDVISISSEGNSVATGDEPILGVVTTVAGFVGNSKESKNYKNKTLVGLLGQISTNVSTIQGDIHHGDHISASELPGFGAKSDAAEYIVGTVLSSDSEISHALTSQNCPDGTEAGLLCGKITLLVSPQVLKTTSLKGTSTIGTGMKSLKIYNSKIKKDSIVMLTAISSTPVTISLAEQKSCEDTDVQSCQAYFLVVTDKALTESLKFNWLIVN